MDTARFDTITRLFAERKLSRRTALRGGAGLAATAGAFALGRVAAQDATPPVEPPDLTDPHPGAADAAPAPEFLFVQSFDGGTWGPKAGEEGVYTLTLNGTSANTIYFSDRPQRIFGLSPTQDFLDTLGFTPANPPNATLVAQGEDGNEEILVIELLNPLYDELTGMLTYDAVVLSDYSDHGLAHAAAQQTGYELAESFGHGGLFIDGCPSYTVDCYMYLEECDVTLFVKTLEHKRCYSPEPGGGCHACVADNPTCQSQCPYVTCSEDSTEFGVCYAEFAPPWDRGTVQ